MADIPVISNDVNSLLERIGLFGPYWIDTEKAVVVYVDNADDLSFARTLDGGATWTKTLIFSGNAKQVSVWFDKETPGDNGTLVHIGWLELNGSDALYITADVNDGTLGTQRTVDGAITVSSVARFNRVALTKTVSGNLIFAFSTQTEFKAYKSINAGVSWSAIADVFENPGQEDWVMLFPADTGDDDDAVAIFWDRSANEISIKMYDDSANAWTETFIENLMFDSDTYKNLDGAILLSNKHLLFAAHSNINDDQADLRTWDLTVNSIASPTITGKANVFTNQDNSAQVAMIINQQNDDVYVAHLKGGTWLSLMDVVFHKSADGMATWGSELPYSQTTRDYRILHGGRTITNSGGRIQWVFYDIDGLSLFVNLVNDIEIFFFDPREVRVVPNLKVTIQAELDGVPVAGFPLIKRMVVDESQQFNYEKAADGDTTTFTALPISELATVEALIINAVDRQITVRIDGQSDAGIELKLGGVLVILDATINVGALNVSINNPDSLNVAFVKGIAAGS